MASRTVGIPGGLPQVETLVETLLETPPSTVEVVEVARGSGAD